LEVLRKIVLIFSVILIYSYVIINIKIEIVDINNKPPLNILVIAIIIKNKDDINLKKVLFLNKYSFI
tara:strand:+ start:112 stop:312 length:201 start_codon:yes stop_codon:yes gene_type:complete